MNAPEALPWFDPETGLLRLWERVTDAPTFRKIMEDGLVTAEEVEAQGQRVVSLLQTLHEQLSPELREDVGHLLTELAVLVTIHRSHLDQERN